MSSFRLFVDGDRIALAGSVDTLQRRPAGAGARRGTDPRTDGVVLDLAALEFVDVAGCRALARWAAGLEERSVPLEVTGRRRSCAGCGSSSTSAAWRR